MKTLYPVLWLAVCGTLAALALSAFAQDEIGRECAEACHAAEERCYRSCHEVEDIDGCERACAEEAEACLAVCE